MEHTRARRLVERELARLQADTGTEMRRRAAPGVPGPHVAADTPGNRITESVDRDLALRTRHHRRGRLLAALDRIEDGSYGRCGTCGAVIDDDRLAVRPETERCREHPEGAVGTGAP